MLAYSNHLNDKAKALNTADCALADLQTSLLQSLQTEWYSREESVKSEVSGLRVKMALLFNRTK